MGGHIHVGVGLEPPLAPLPEPIPEPAPLEAACPARLTAVPSMLLMTRSVLVVSMSILSSCFVTNIFELVPGQGKAIIGDDGTHFLLQYCTKPDSSAQRLGQDKGTNSRKDCVDKYLGTTYPTCDSIQSFTLPPSLSEFL